MAAIDVFKKAFLGFAPFNDGVALWYPFRDKAWSERAQEKAIEIILANGLPLVAATENCEWRGEPRVALVIRAVPEEHSFADEVPDTEEYEEERAEWIQ